LRTGHLATLVILFENRTPGNPRDPVLVVCFDGAEDLIDVYTFPGAMILFRKKIISSSLHMFSLMLLG